MYYVSPKIEILFIGNKKVPWFQSFKDSVNPYYQNFISCSQEDIDPTSKIIKISFDGSSECSGARLFENGRQLGFPTF